MDRAFFTQRNGRPRHGRPASLHTAGVVVQRLAEGRVTPFVGAGANMAGRPAGFEWSRGSGFLPSGAELASYLAERSKLRG